MLATRINTRLCNLCLRHQKGELRERGQGNSTCAVVIGTAPGWSIKNCLSSRRSADQIEQLQFLASSPKNLQVRSQNIQTNSFSGNLDENYFIFRTQGAGLFFLKLLSHNLINIRNSVQQKNSLFSYLKMITQFLRHMTPRRQPHCPHITHPHTRANYNDHLNCRSCRK